MSELTKEAMIRQAYDDLHDAINVTFDKFVELGEFTKSYCEEHDDDVPDLKGYIPVEWSLSIGAVRIDSDGDRDGRTFLLVKGGDQSSWVTRGLLAEASELASILEMD